MSLRILLTAVALLEATLAFQTGAVSYSNRGCRSLASVSKPGLFDISGAPRTFFGISQAPEIGLSLRMKPAAKLAEFDLEVFFAEWEFKAKYLMCCSDAESMSMGEILDLADEECLQLWKELRLGYTETQGLPVLRDEIVKQYPGMKADDVFCFSGAEEGIYTAMRSLLQPADHVIVVTPCYQSLKSVADAMCEVTCIDLVQSDCWRLDTDKLSASIKASTKMVIMNFPHNPTGALLTEEEQDKLVQICRAKGVWLFSDEVYRGIEVGESVKRLPPIASKYEKGISLGVMSKALGLAGLRVGWVASQDKEALTALAGYKHYLSICNSAPSEILSLIALRNMDAILAKNTQLVRSNFALLERFMLKWSHVFDWTPPKAGCCGFVRYKGGAAGAAGVGAGVAENNRQDFATNNRQDFTTLALALVEQHGVLTLPGKFFPSDPEQEQPFQDHFRVGFGRLNFPEVLAQFDTAMTALEAADSGDSGDAKRQKTS